jgi:hypothetical protein
MSLFQDFHSRRPVPWLGLIRTCGPIDERQRYTSSLGVREKGSLGVREKGPFRGKAASDMGATPSAKATTAAAAPHPRTSASIPGAHPARAATANIVVALHIMAPTSRRRERSIL